MITETTDPTPIVATLTERQLAVEHIKACASADALDPLIATAGTIDKQTIISGENVVYIHDPLAKRGIDDGSAVDQDLTVIYGVTPIYYKNPSNINYRVVDWHSIQVFEDYIVFSGIELTPLGAQEPNQVSGRLFVVRNTQAMKEHLHCSERRNRTANAALWLFGTEDQTAVL